MTMIGLHKIGPKKGYAVAYKTAFGMQVLRDENGDPVELKKTDVHAHNYGAGNEATRVWNAMHSKCWPLGVLIDFSGQ